MSCNPRDYQECQSARPSAPAITTAFSPGHASLGSKPDSAPTSPSQSQGEEALAEAGQLDAAAGSGTDATATGYEDGGHNANAPSTVQPGSFPEGWIRQISQMIQDVVHQQPVGSRALLECVSQHADAVAKAVFESDYAQSTGLWKRSGGSTTPETATEGNTGAPRFDTDRQARQRLRADDLSTALVQAGGADNPGVIPCQHDLNRDSLRKSSVSH